MFFGTSSFNQPLNSWNFSSIVNMSGMFNSASSFNQPLTNWDVSSVVNMGFMFYDAISFNQPLDTWAVDSLIYGQYMFSGASSFNQPLANWNISSVTDLTGMFDHIHIDHLYYDAMLQKWSTLPLHSYLTLDMGNSLYSINALPYRNYLISHFNWTINDGGMYEQTKPVISNQPDDITLEYGYLTYQRIVWSVGDKHPDSYTIKRNGDLLAKNNWSNGTIEWFIPRGLSDGNYTYVLTIYDTSRNSASDSVLVLVKLVPYSSTTHSTSINSTSNSQFSGIPQIQLDFLTVLFFSSLFVLTVIYQGRKRR